VESTRCWYVNTPVFTQLLPASAVSDEDHGDTGAQDPGAAASDSPSPSSTDGEQPVVVLAKALDVSRFGFFKRFAARKFIASVAHTVALSTAAGRRQTVQHKGTPILLSALGRLILLLCRSRALNRSGLTESTRYIATTPTASAPSCSPTTTTPTGAPTPSSSRYHAPVACSTRIIRSGFPS
jgi:hypothetical protein